MDPAVVAVWSQTTKAARNAAVLLTTAPAGGGLHPLHAVGGLALFGFVHSALASRTVKRWVLQASDSAAHVDAVTHRAVPHRQQRHSAALRYYRLGFTAVSVATVAPLLWWAARDAAAPVVVHTGRRALAVAGLRYGALACFAHSLTAFDVLSFLGLRQAFASDAGAVGHTRAVHQETEVGDLTDAHRSAAAAKEAEVEEVREAQGEGITEVHPMTLSVWHRYVRHPWYCFSIIAIWCNASYTPAQLALTAAMTTYFVVGTWLEERKLVAAFGDAYAQYRGLVPALVPAPLLWSITAEQARDLMAASARFVALAPPVLEM